MTAVPLTLVTGFFGAGKTTTLNRLLRAGAAGKRVALVINDVGRIALDRDLVRGQSGDLIELSGGCVCCKIDTQRDLWTSLADLIERAQPEQLLLETTGIAEPHTLLLAWRGEPLVRHKLRPAGVVCVVDAEVGARAFERRESREQARVADRVLLTKLDVAPAATVAALHAALDERAPKAERAAFGAGEEQALARWLLEPRRLDEHERAPEAHDHQLTMMTYETTQPLLGDALRACFERFGAKLVRAKGYAQLAGEPRRVFVERAGAALTLTTDGEWTGPPRTALLLVCEGVDEATVRRQLAAVTVGAAAL